MNGSYTDPVNFVFERPAEWPDWRQRFERYRIATNLNKDDGVVQVSCLIYAMGSEAENVLKSFLLPRKTRRILTSLTSTSFRGEMSSMNGRVQKPGEKAESFITALYDLSEHCDFGASREENIRDRIVVGIMDKDISRKLQLMKDLTLADTIQTVRQAEEVARQVNMQGEAVGTVHEVTQKSHKYPTSKQHRGPKDRKGGDERKCFKCGKTQHNKEENCPAKKAICHVCHRVGHWARVCRSKKQVNEVTEQPSYFLGTVNNVGKEREQWSVELLLGKKPVVFKIDTGADVNVVSEETYHTHTHTHRNVH